MVRRGYLITAAALAVLLAGCNGAGDPEGVRVYFLQGHLGPLGPRGQLLGVERRQENGQVPASAALIALLHGPTDAERERGLLTTIPAEVRLLDLSVRRGTATVDLTSPLLPATQADWPLGTTIDGAAQIVYTVTELPGIEQVVLRFEGRRCCMWDLKSRVLSVPLTRAMFKGWGGEPCELRATPAPACARSPTAAS